MKKFSVKTTLFLFLLGLSSSTCYAVDISIVGADPGPNDTGEIPAYEGQEGLTCPAGFIKGQYLPNPYKDEKKLYRIDHTNVEKYKDRLSPGQIMRLKKHKKFYMNVYPTHRNVEFCDEYYAAILKNRENCYVDDKNVIQNFHGGVAFPLPKNGVEAIWNIKRMYSGDDARILTYQRLVSPTGKITKSIWEVKVLNYGSCRLKAHPFPNPNNLSQKVYQATLYPADIAGQSFLSINHLDDNKKEDTWLYLPALRRVRRAPSMSGGGGLGGELTMDENGLEFRGAVNDWTWKLLGKREMYVSNNNYDIWALGATDADECWPLDINPERLRYELMRVWVVEGTAIEGLNHPYSKRVGYYDEDSWQPAFAERYDKRGKLWRTYESYPAADYCNKYKMIIGYIYLNLESGRYEVFGGGRTKDSYNTIYDTGLKESEFTVQALRRAGR